MRSKVSWLLAIVAVVGLAIGGVGGYLANWSKAQTGQPQVITAGDLNAKITGGIQIVPVAAADCRTGATPAAPQPTVTNATVVFGEFDGKLRVMIPVTLTLVGDHLRGAVSAAVTTVSTNPASALPATATIGADKVQIVDNNGDVVSGKDTSGKDRVITQSGQYWVQFEIQNTIPAANPTQPANIFDPIASPPPAALAPLVGSVAFSSPALAVSSAAQSLSVLAVQNVPTGVLGPRTESVKITQVKITLNQVRS